MYAVAVQDAKTDAAPMPVNASLDAPLARVVLTVSIPDPLYISRTAAAAADDVATAPTLEKASTDKPDVAAKDPTAPVPTNVSLPPALDADAEEATPALENLSAAAVLELAKLPAAPAPPIVSAPEPADVDSVVLAAPVPRNVSVAVVLLELAELLAPPIAPNVSTPVPMEVDSVVVLESAAAKVSVPAVAEVVGFFAAAVEVKYSAAVPADVTSVAGAPVAL